MTRCYLLSTCPMFICGPNKPINGRISFTNDRHATMKTYDRKMKAYRGITRIMLAAALALCAWFSLAADRTMPPAIAGHWEGDARIIVDWCHQKTLRVSLTIGADGKVAGKVGDATLVNGLLDRNRGWLGRKLNLATDYIIRGELNGPVVAAESITRKAVNIPVDASGSSLVGGLHTSGTKFGGKGAGILSASSMLLRR
jgi:hypothetical protein